MSLDSDVGIPESQIELLNVGGNSESSKR
jgi:hypothetical protein